MKTENKVATYKRVSKNENGGGIKDQAAELAKYAKEQGMECLPSFGERLKKARSAAGLSQKKMADLTLIPARTIEEWEAGRRIPPHYVQRFVLNELRSMGAEKATETAHDQSADTATYVRVQRQPGEEHEGNVWQPPLGCDEESPYAASKEEAEIVRRAEEEMARDRRLSYETGEALRRVIMKRAERSAEKRRKTN